MHTQESGKGMKKLKNVKIKKILAFTVALALTMSCMPSAYTISADEIFGDGTEELFTDGTEDSVWTAEEVISDSDSADQEQQVQQSMLTYENDAVRVTAEAQDEGAIPQNASFRVDTVSGNSSVSYDTVSQKLTWIAENKGSSLRGFFAYDVYFVDAGGNRVDPNGRVKITIESKTLTAPELNDMANTNVTVQKLRYNGSTGDTDVYELQAGGELKVLNVNDYRQLETVQVETGNNAVFAVMWDSAEVSAEPEVNEEAGEVGQTEGNSEEADFTDSETEVPVPEQPVENPDVQAEEKTAENPDGQAEEKAAENPDVQEEEKAAENPDGQAEEKAAENPDVQEEEKAAENQDGQEEEQPAENSDGQGDENQPENPDGNPEADPEKNADEADGENPQDSENAEKDDSEADEDQDAETETSYIEVIADDVNLHVSPSEEAEVIDIVNSGTRLPLLETVSAEDGITWYKVSWNEAEAYIRSDMVQLIEKEDEEPAEEEVTDMELEEPVTYTRTIDNVIVTAIAESGVIPEDAEFIVTPVEKETAQYSEVASQLENKAKNENYSIEGFLAYDIYFAGSDGEKINPEAGKVKISMEYQKSEAPEEIRETAGAETFSLDGADNAENDQLFQSGENENAAQQTFDIAVMHLVEDEDGNVQSVVDMTQDGTASVETSAEGEVQKAEFETESFSVFTITWTNTNSKLSIRVVDTAGNEIGQNSSVSLNSGTEYSVSDIAGRIQNVGNYSFYKAKVSSTAKDTGTEIKRLRYSKQKNQYSSADSGDSWNNVSGTVYFVYAKNPETVGTVNHTSDGIIMTMKNLDGNNVAIGPDSNSRIDIGGSYGNGSIKKNLLRTLLGNNGYPIASNSGKNLESLFNGKEVNHLFLSSVYNSTGYYEYSSFKNYAYLGNNNSKFTVYDVIGTPKNEDRYFYKRGNFMPYNEIANGKFSTNANLYDEDGKKLADTDPEKGRELYLTQGTNDYYFSMYMGANFLQPKNGKATLPDGSTKQDMIYEFNGDDDMWIYIDGVLVLDIGGVHDAHSGKINFNTGVVSWKDCQTGNDPVESSTTLKAIFQTAGVFPDGTGWDDSKVGNYFTGNTFKDYTTHTFKMFYMERGAGASNLHVKFNIQVIPSGQVEVRKELSNTDKEKYSNVKFAFQLYAQKALSTGAQKNETYSDTEYELLNSSAYYGNAGKPVKDKAITFYNGEDGTGEIINGKKYQNVFYLKPDESAIFTDLQANRKYYLKEIGVKSDEYSQITINDTGYTEYDENNQEAGKGVIKSVETDKKEVSMRPVVVYTNNCSAANSRELQITKKMNPDVETSDTFTFNIELGASEQDLQNYSGDYYLKDSSGNYYYYNDKNQLTNNGTSAIVCGTIENGVVSGIRKDFTVVITGILSGTYYRVTEVLSTEDQEKYENPVYETRNIVRAGETGHQDEEGAVGNAGTIKLYYDAAVTVTNTPYSKIKVNKVWKAGSSVTAGTVPVYAGLYQRTVNDGVETLTPVEGKYLELNTDNNYEAVFDKLDSRIEYVVKELRPAAGNENADFTIKVNETDTGYVRADTTIMIGDAEYKVDYSNLTVDEQNKMQKNITVTNQRFCSITIIKVDSENSELLLAGAEFKLQKDGADVTDKNGNVITVTTNSEGKAKFSELEPGTYTIIETKAPQGYSLLSDGIEVTVRDGENLAFDAVKIVSNTKLYSLPSSGGPGIYGFTISGVAILATALLLFITNKRKEEEAERS